MKSTASDAISQHIEMLTQNSADIIAKQPNIKKLPRLIKDLPIMPLRGMVVFPGLTIPLTVEREFNKQMLRAAEAEGSLLFLVTQTDMVDTVISRSQLNDVGVLAQLLKIIELPNGELSALISMLGPAKLTKLALTEPYLRGNAQRLNEKFPPKADEELMDTLAGTVLKNYREILSIIGDEETQNMTQALAKIDNPLIMLHFICVNSPLETEQKQELLATMSIKERTEKLALYLDRAKQLMLIRADVARRTQERLTQQQKEHFLRQQINVMEEELGGTFEDEELNELEARAEKKVWSEDAQKHFNKEMRKLERFPGSSPEYGIQYNYLDTMLNLPWENYSQDNFDLDKVRKQLDADHFGLEKVKERIVEQMAVLKLRGDMRAPILCLYGPPGVGKTSLGRSIATAVGRQYERVALGGVHDEAEIRGHRRTYIGALPGRIIAALEKVGTGNPLLVLDEIDKIAKESKGDPSTALLEVLDPEQNNKFHDNYLNFDYDLSKVMFIATANDLSTISRPLRDRMELIEIPGYVTDEKLSIATRHLLPKVLKDHGLEADAFTITHDALTYIIERYTRESGVRQLEKQLAKLIRKLAVRQLDGLQVPSEIDMTLVRELLGNELVDPDEYEGNRQAGVVTGLAWTAVGGEILYVEVSLSPGKGRLTLTGQLGDVMKESATLALQYLKAHAPQYGLTIEQFDAWDVHVHVPQGAIPKDGPSAGITITTALASAFTRRLVAPSLAMTGEITLRGKVLPVGGIKEKILAAKRAGIKTIMLCTQNRKDIDEIPADYLKGLTFIYVDTIDQVLDKALLTDIDTSLPERIVPPKKKEI